MDGTLGLIGLAVAAFASTNVDDMVLLGLFFSSRTSRAGQVVAGQYLGIGALVGLSLIIASAATLVPAGWIHWLGILPIAIGLRWLVPLVQSRSSRDACPLEDIAKTSRAESSSSIVSVALVTFANGGDNLGVYTPMFAASSLPQALVIIAVFLVLTGAWCLGGFLLTRNPLFGERLRRVGQLIAPFVLIAIGLRIVLEL